jgi:hypothetical protein
MSSRLRPDRRRRVLVVLACVAGIGTPLAAQRTALPPDRAANSIRCWWQTDKDAVVIGEQFRLTVTCGVVENERTKVAADLKQFEPAALALAPFEVLDATVHQDIEAPPWRYFQREYRLRLLGETFFGRDVDIPALKIVYGLRSASTGEAEGRDQAIVLPAIPIRVHSLVAKGVGGIRDGSNETFADIEGGLARAKTTLTAAGVFFGFAVVLLGLSFRAALGRYRERAPAKKPPLSTGALLQGCASSVAALRTDVGREGWTDELVGRALALFRVAGAVALGRRVAETPVRDNAEARTGQVVVRRGVLSRKRALVSAATTADLIATYLSNGAAPDAASTLALGEIRDSLLVFNAAHYRRDGHLDEPALDAALESGAAALRRLQSSSRWPRLTAVTLARSLAGKSGAAT